MVTKQISLANSALVLVGAVRIQSFDEGSTESVVIQEFYERTFRALLSSYPWKFASKQRSLPLIPEKPEYEYEFMFQLPSDYVWIQRAFPNQDYKILGDRLHSNYKEIGINYTWRVEEELMSIPFEQTFVYYLASQICISLTEDSQKQQVLYTQYMDHARTARSLDSQQHPTDGWEDFPVDSIRYT